MLSFFYFFYIVSIVLNVGTLHPHNKQQAG